MKKKILLTMLFIGFSSLLFAQSNVKVIEYKILKFKGEKKIEYTVPKGETWRIESIITRKEEKIEFYLDDEMYILLYAHHVGLSDEFCPFKLPEGTKFSIKPVSNSIALGIAVLKIE